MDETIFQEYVKAWRNRKKEAERRQAESLRQAREAASKLARILVQDYRAGEVWLFGSLARIRGFHRRSDIDLAASGLMDLDSASYLAGKP
ncbi:MAG: nucleotidyltransferase domain-containing protein [Armatimonadetes bacterium]|nr:nucleotidyltransferase domain-containing protein [Armatimonadota bacterium]